MPHDTYPVNDTYNPSYSPDLTIGFEYRVVMIGLYHGLEFTGTLTNIIQNDRFVFQITPGTKVRKVVKGSSLVEEVVAATWGNGLEGVFKQHLKFWERLTPETDREKLQVLQEQLTRYA